MLRFTLYSLRRFSPSYQSAFQRSLAVLVNYRFQVGGQAVLGRQSAYATPWLTERHGYDPTCLHVCVCLMCNVTIYAIQSQTLFTLLSECFSTFPRGTCELSVSCSVFSLRRNLPPDSSCIIKQLYSSALSCPYIYTNRRLSLPLVLRE